jgi:hypothetical protein
LQTELDAAGRQLATTRQALSLARQRMSDEGEQRQAELVAAAIPKHREQVLRVAEAAVRLALALREEQAIRNAVMRPDRWYTTELPPMQLPWLRGGLDVSDPESNLCRFIRECVEREFLTGSEPFLKGVNWRRK